VSARILFFVIESRQPRRVAGEAFAGALGSFRSKEEEHVAIAPRLI
jgi:hypothetical protein